MDISTDWDSSKKGIIKKYAGKTTRAAENVGNVVAAAQAKKQGIAAKLFSGKRQLSDKEKASKLKDLQHEYQEEALKTKISKAKAARPKSSFLTGLGGYGNGGGFSNGLGANSGYKPMSWSGMDSLFGGSYGNAKVSRPKSARVKKSGMNSLFGF